MKISILIFTFVLNTFILANEHENIGTNRLLFLDGKKHPSNQIVLDDLRSVSTGLTKKYLSEFTILSASQGKTEPSGTRGSLFVKNGCRAKYFNNMSEFCSFITTRIKSLKTEKEAEEIALLIPSVFSYEVIPTPPKKIGGIKYTPKKIRAYVRLGLCPFENLG